MLYFIVRVLVNMTALALTIALLPGLHLMEISLAQAEINPEIPAYLEPWLPLIIYSVIFFFVALAFWFWNWVFWPIILFFTGRLVVWSFGLLLVIGNAVLFYLVTEVGQDDNWLEADSPVWFWVLLGGLMMTLLLWLFEGITGLDSPLKEKSHRRRRYWQILRRFTFGGRNYFAENLRIAQSLDTAIIYLRDIVFDASPFGPIRRFFQHIIYWRKKPLIAESAPETVRYLLQELGPTFVKLGQIIGSRAEQLPPAWRKQLALLQSDVEPFSATDAEAIITQQLGKSPGELYASFDPEPLAAASTAQVHRARLPDGTDVVVKVQRPDIDVTVRADLNVMSDLTTVVERRSAWARNSNLNGILTEYAENILLELDYTNEAFNGQMLAQNMAEFPTVHVPTVYTALSTAKVMTQEFVKGVKITNTAALDAAGLDRTQLAVTFMRAIVKQVLYDGFFHGDPHPGNVLVNTETGTIIFLDMGMMGTLTQQKRMAIVDLLWSLSSGDKREIAKTVLRLSTSYKEVDEASFIEEVERLLTRYTSFSGGSMSIGGAMKALFDAMYNAGLRMDPQLTLALKAMIQAEETVRTLDPQLPLVDTAFDATKSLLRETFDADTVIAALRQQVVRGARDAIRNIPAIEDAVLSWIQQFRSGKFTVFVDTSDLGRQVDEFDRTLTKNIRSLTLALLLVGLLIGSSIASNTPGDLLPNLPEIAYFIFLGAARITWAVVLRAVFRWLSSGDF
jgi:ubiquinone biosynthesis protein